MKHKNNLSLFSFSSGQRKGIFALVFVIVLLQFMYWFLDFTPDNRNVLTKTKWLSFQSAIDSLKGVSKTPSFIYPFNPNFISDFKGYKLGMSVEEIDRLHAFRKTNSFINSPEDFQRVTGVSDSLLNVIAPYFKFPDWVNQKNNKISSTTSFKPKLVKIKKDINLATAEDLIKVYGIGEVLANRIIFHRDELGAFVDFDQLLDVFGLRPETLLELQASFVLVKKPIVNLIDVNNASQKELSQFYYFKYSLARQILIFRSMNGDIKNIEDLSKIKGFPVDKAKIIALYLKF